MNNELYEKNERDHIIYKPNNKNNKIGNYQIIKTMGEGTFGKVKLGIHIPTNEKVAIKILEKSKIEDNDDLKCINREISFLKTLNHINIISLYEIIENSEYYYLIMEYAENDLFSYIVENNYLSEEISSLFYYQLINAIEYIHKNKIAHRDLKPENILLTRNNSILKIIDFGLANSYKKNNTSNKNINNINDENDNINLDNNIILETENEKNLTDERDNNTNNINNVKDINQLNSPIQNELIKEKVEGGFINGIINNNLDNKIKNKKVEYSEYISDKNKSTMRNLLYLLEKKPEEKKNQKSLFRASINTLEKREKNKLLDIVYQNRKNIYKTVLENEFKKINSINMVKTPNLVNNINSLNKNDKTAKTPNMETPFLPGNYEDKYQNMKNKYLIMTSTPVPRRQYPSFYHDKYFMDYVDGRCPNLCVIERNMKYEKKIHEANLIDTISERHKLNRSFNDKFHFMGKNDLSVEKRDNRYMYYNYKFMVNAIDDKLNGNINDSDFRHSFQPLNKTYSDFHINRGSSESYRNPRISKLYNEINNNIYSVGPESRMRKTVSERNPFL